MLKWLPIIGPLLCEYGQAYAADRAKAEMHGAIRRLIFWTALMIASAVVAIVIDVPAIGDTVLRAIVICYTIEGVIKGVIALREVRQQFNSWPASLLDVTIVNVIRVGGIPLVSLVLLYTVAWSLRYAMGAALGVTFWGWIWSSLAVW